MFNRIKVLLQSRQRRFVLLFIAGYGVLYMVNYALTGMLQPGGYYSVWMDDNLDYVTGFRAFLLHSTATVAEYFGHTTFLKDNVLHVKGGHNIRIVYSCIGFNILCVWWAFVVSLPMQIKKKVLHFTLGTICLVALNITRLSMLAMSSRDYSFGQLVVDHHTIYNWVVYSVILIVMKRLIDNRVMLCK